MSSASVPRSTPHSPLGAAACLTFGAPGEPAAITSGEQLSAPRDLWIGCRHAPDAPWSLLPFFAPAPDKPAPLPKGRYGRFLGWAGDKWMIGPLVFKLCTPFETTPSPDDEHLLQVPVLCGYLEYDNTHSDDAVELIFGLSGAGAALETAGFLGAAWNEGCGFATGHDAGVSLVSDLGVLGFSSLPAAAIHVRVPPHTKHVRPIVFGFHQPGFHYDTLVGDLPAVLHFGLREHARFLALADARDGELMRSSLPLDARARTAMDVRVWLAGSVRRRGDPPVDLTPLRDLVATVRG